MPCPIHFCDLQKSDFPAGTGRPAFRWAQTCRLHLWRKQSPVSCSVVAKLDEVPQAVNARRIKMARDATIAFFNFILFTLLVLFFIIFNLLLNII